MTTLPPCEDTTPGPHAVVPALVLAQELHLVPVAQRVLLCASIAGRSYMPDVVHTTLGLWYDLLGMDPNAPETYDQAMAVAQAITNHRDDVTAHVAPF